MEKQKYCKHCGALIDEDCVVCPKCGKQVETLGGRENPSIVINNANANSNVNQNSNGSIGERLCSKWVSFALCVFLGVFGAHKFYEGKIGTGIVYLCTGGLFCIGWIIDIFNILGKPDPYRV